MRPNRSAPRVILQAWGLTALGGAIGAALGYGLDLALQQAGWVLVVGSMGLCAGASLAGRRATHVTSPPSPVEPAPPAPVAQPTE